MADCWSPLAEHLTQEFWWKQRTPASNKDAPQRCKCRQRITLKKTAGLHANWKPDCLLPPSGEQHFCLQSLASEAFPKEHTSFRPGEESILKANPSPVYLGFHYSTPSPLKEMRCHVIYNNMAVILNQLKPETDYFPPGGKHLKYLNRSKLLLALLSGSSPITRCSYLFCKANPHPAPLLLVSNPPPTWCSS